MAFDVSSQNLQVMGMLKGGTAFNQGVVGSMTGSISQANTAAVLMGASVAADLSGLASRMSTLVTGSFASFSAHLTDAFAKLPQNLSIAAAQTSLQGGLISIGGALDGFTNIGSATDLCANINNLFGSIMGAGMALINQVNALTAQIMRAVASMINAAQDVINAAVATLNSLVAQVEAMAAQMVAMAQAEVAALAAALADMLNFGFALNLLNLLNNPCIATVLSAVGSTSLKSTLGI